MHKKKPLEISKLFFAEASLEHPNLEKIRQYILEGADVNYQDEEGTSALMAAVQNNNLELVELLLMNEADPTLTRKDGWDVEMMVVDEVIFQTLNQGAPLSEEDKAYYRNRVNEEELAEEAREKTLKERAGKPFDLSQLKFDDIEEAASKDLIIEIGQYYKHPLPKLLLEIYRKYNGGQPSVNVYDSDGEYRIHYFYALSDNGDLSWNNVWNSIENNSDYLGPDTLPIAVDIYGSIIYLKWCNGKSEVWLFQYGDQILDEDDDDEDVMPTAFFKLSDSLGAFLESLYEMG